MPEQPTETGARRPRLLDAYCCAGGASVGYARDTVCLAEAIPPAYTEHLGAQLLAAVRNEVAA